MIIYHCYHHHFSFAPSSFLYLTVRVSVDKSQSPFLIIGFTSVSSTVYVLLQWSQGERNTKGQKGHLGDLVIQSRSISWSSARALRLERSNEKHSAVEFVVLAGYTPYLVKTGCTLTGSI